MFHRAVEPKASTSAKGFLDESSVLQPAPLASAVITEGAESVAGITAAGSLH
jgi:hypothetical protein